MLFGPKYKRNARPACRLSSVDVNLSLRGGGSWFRDALIKANDFCGWIDNGYKKREEYYLPKLKDILDKEKKKRDEFKKAKV